MNDRTIHPDWPAYEPDAKWQDAPLDDLEYALGREPIDGGPITIPDIKRITHYAVSYHGERWTPGNLGHTELDLLVVAELHDGRWVTVEAWNDYTGWGCQDGADVTIAGSEAEAHAQLSDSARIDLGIKQPVDMPGLYREER